MVIVLLKLYKWKEKFLNSLNGDFMEVDSTIEIHEKVIAIQ